MRSRRTVCAALCAATVAGLSVSPAASGSSVTPATHKYADEMLREAVIVGLTFWRARGFTPKPPDLLVYSTSVTRYDAVAVPGEPRVWVTRRYRDDAWAIVNDTSYLLAERRAELEDVCQVMTHELGHTLGATIQRLVGPLDENGHARYGIMADGPHGKHARLHECARWARSKLPRRHHA